MFEKFVMIKIKEIEYFEQIIIEKWEFCTNVSHKIRNCLINLKNELSLTEDFKIFLNTWNNGSGSTRLLLRFKNISEHTL